MFLLAYFLLAGLLVFLLNWLALIPWRRSAGMHWTERSRALYPARVAAVWNRLIVPANCVLAGITIFPSSERNWFLFAMAAWLGGSIGGYPLIKEVFPQFSFKMWLHQTIASLSLRFAGWLPLVVGFLIMPDEFNWEAWAIAIGVAICRLLFLWGFGIRLARWLHVFKAAPENLRRIVDETSQRLGVPVRNVWLLDTVTSYAAAYPTTRELVFSNFQLPTTFAT